MRLGTLKDGSRDGKLVIFNKDNTEWISAGSVCDTLQQALDNWDAIAPKLEALSDNFKEHPATKVAFKDFHSPLPRAYEWVDGSAYINHIVLVRKARGAEPPPTLKTEPLVYQGGSGIFLAPYDDIPLANTEWGLDFESEVCVILGDTPQGVKAADAAPYIKLILICNDVSLRNLIPNELQKGFGFFNSKPATAFSPVCLTPSELGDYWRDGRLHLPLKTELNGEWYGDPDAGPEMHFSFFELIEHICKTRSFTAGTILGSGTVSNHDVKKGSSCLAEKRMLEKINEGGIKTPFLSPGDTVKIAALSPDGASVFGDISQKVTQI